MAGEQNAGAQESRLLLEEEALYEARWPIAARRAYHAEHPENFASPDGGLDFPIKDADDVSSAVRLYGHSSDPEKTKARIISIAYRLHLQHALPDDWKHTDDQDKAKETTQEAQSQAFATPAAPPPDSSSKFSPRQRIAQITACWLEVDAISLNGRQYTEEAFNALVRNAQLDLADPDVPPLTCYVSHGEAENDNSLELVGVITQVWAEGRKAYATIDIPDTTAGRDIVALTRWHYLRPISLRAIEASLRIDKNRSLPQVCGNPRLRGIDFTTTPGLPKIATVQQVMLESAQQNSGSISLTEVFSYDPATLLREQQEEAIPAMTTKLKEEVVMAPLASGNSASVTDDPTQGDYARRMYTVPPVKPPDYVPGQAAPTIGQVDLEALHHHAAAALGMACAPKGFQEAGKALNKKNRAHFAAIHNTAAKALGMACEARYDPDGDGDDDSTSNPATNPDAAQDRAQGMQFPDDSEDDSMENQKKPTPEQMAAFLRENGYQVTPPKTPEQLIEEAKAQMQAEFDRKLSEAVARLTPVQQPDQQVQRQSLVEGAGQNAAASGTSQRPPNMYRAGQYLREQAAQINWRDIADRSHPLPQGVTAGRLLKEVSRVMVAHALVPGSGF